MIFDIGDVIGVAGKGFRVIGKIRYENTHDHCEWDEYRIRDMETGQEAWLSIDDVYQEYSISYMASSQPPDLMRYHKVDEGIEIVRSYAGSVDVDLGESASFAEYEDPTEELIISRESWSDGIEWSTGHYLDADEITLVRHDPSYTRAQSIPGLIIVGIMVLIFAACFIGPLLSSIEFQPKISKYLKKSPYYTYETSVTGQDSQKAQVYRANAWTNADGVAMDIITELHGLTEYVQKDDEEENGAIAILTEKEYCVIYPSEDQSCLLVQVSNRKYAYKSDNDLYKGSRRASHYYRSFYHSTGYSSDTSTYHNSSSPYSSYSDADFSYSSDNSFNSYSSSIRQSSINSRVSSGGGLSGGK